MNTLHVSSRKCDATPLMREYSIKQPSPPFLAMLWWLGITLRMPSSKFMNVRILFIGMFAVFILLCGVLATSGYPIAKEKNGARLVEMVNREVRERILREVRAHHVSHNTGNSFPEMQELPYSKRKRILVTGGAGFVGSHLVDKLMTEGHDVIVMDNFFTGRKKNIEHWLGHTRFELINHDVTEPIFLQCDQIYHLACPASPPHYQYNPVKTIKTSTLGTLNMLGLARRVRARLLLASTSEIYGDPQVHPQSEDYWGHVNPIGPRACYDEGKRVAETMCYAYEKQEGLQVRVARIFNTFGPRMHPNDGRVVSNFIMQALEGKDITVYGDGKQTRSFQYVSDLVAGLYKLMNSENNLPTNLGNPVETTINDFAKYIRKHVNEDVQIIHRAAATDDPQQRKPNITRAKSLINWEPVVDLDAGIEKTVKYFKTYIANTDRK